MRVQVFQIEVGVEGGKGRARHDALAFRDFPAVLQRAGFLQQAAQKGERLRVPNQIIYD